MRNTHFHLPFSPLSLSGWVVAILSVVYLGLIAAVMSYAALTIEFSQSIRTDESAVAALEKEYLSAVAHIMTIDYGAANYVLPTVKTYVGTKSVTALR